MKFREYRPKGTIKAAEIDQDELELMIAQPEGESQKVDPIMFKRGDYAEYRDGRLWGWAKAAFEAAYAPMRAARTVRNKPRKKAAVATATPKTD